MSFSASGDKNHAYSVPAVADVQGARFVKFDGSYADDDADVVGATEAPARAGESLSIVTYFSAPVEAAATIAKGDKVGVSGDGTGRAVPGGNVGIAATGGVAGTKVEVMMMRRPGTGGEGGSAPETQFGVVHAGMITTPVRITATGQPAGFSAPCLVESIMCITPGTGGPVTIHDADDAADASKLRFSRAVADMVAGQLYPLSGDGSAVVFTTGMYITNSAGGLYVVNAVPEVE